MVSINSEVRVNFPDELINKKELVGILTNSIGEIGFAYFNDYFAKSTSPYLFSVYLLKWEDNDSFYIVDRELYIFNFDSEDDREWFRESLPDLSPFELLQFLRPQPDLN